MNLRKFRRFFLDKVSSVDRRRTCDRILFGSPDAEVHRVLVTWIADTDALTYAAQNGFDTVMTHEAAFYYHEKDLKDILPFVDPVMHPSIREKCRIAAGAGIAVIRNHDVWDRFEDICPAMSLARFLGIDAPPAAKNGMQFRYDIPPLTAESFAANMAQTLAPLGQDSVEMFGDGSKPVSRIGFCTGQAGSIPVFVRMGCDCAVISDDGSNYWKNIVWANENGFPVFRISHFTAEEPSMLALTDYINTAFAADGITARHFMHTRRCTVIHT